VAEISALPANTTNPPTGQVTYFVGVRGYAVKTLTDGVAMLRLPAARVLRHFLYVRYSGDVNYQATLSLSEVVNNASIRTSAQTAKTEHLASVVKVSKRTPFSRVTALSHAAHPKNRHA
jgi:hypothetical protein